MVAMAVVLAEAVAKDVVVAADSCGDSCSSGYDGDCGWLL
jgi:hypothetical protein